MRGQGCTKCREDLHFCDDNRSMPSRPRPAAAVPAFALYGEAGAPALDMLHVESLQSRSRLYRWSIDAHVHHGLYQLIWLQCGPAEVRLDDLHRTCRGPALIVVPPTAVHGFRFEADTEGQVLTLSPRSLLEGDLAAAGDALRALFEHPRLLVLPAAEADRIATMFALLLGEFEAPGSGVSPVPLWLARALVWRLAGLSAQIDEAATPAARGQQLRYTRFLSLVEAHYREHWPVARYAERLGLSVERLNRLVRAESGRTPLALVHDRLAREACRRVVYVAAPISRLAFELGFDDPAYFCRFFKRRTGLSPRDYRRRSLA